MSETSTCWARGVAGKRTHMDNLVIRHRIGEFDSLAVILCHDCIWKVRNLLSDIQDQSAAQQQQQASALPGRGEGEG